LIVNSSPGLFDEYSILTIGSARRQTVYSYLQEHRDWLFAVFLLPSTLSQHKLFMMYFVLGEVIYHRYLVLCLFYTLDFKIIKSYFRQNCTCFRQTYQGC